MFEGVGFHGRTVFAGNGRRTQKPEALSRPELEMGWRRVLPSALCGSFGMLPPDDPIYAVFSAASVFSSASTALPITQTLPGCQDERDSLTGEPF